jgi:hypothetical protein
LFLRVRETAKEDDAILQKRERAERKQLRIRITTQTRVKLKEKSKWKKSRKGSRTQLSRDRPA